MTIRIKNPALPAFLLFLLSGALLASSQANPPIDTQYSHYYQASAPYLFFNTDVFGNPVMRLVFDPNEIILSPPNADRNDLPNNAVLCPGKLNATIDAGQVVWAHTHFNGSSPFNGPSTRPFPNALSGSNPISSNIPIIANSSFANELIGMANPFIRRADASPPNIWNRADAAVQTPQNVRYFRVVPPPPYNCVWTNSFGNCTPSSESKASMICNGSVNVNAYAQPISSQQTPVVLVPDKFQAPLGPFTASGNMRLDRCIGMVHYLPDDTPQGSSSYDRIYMFRVPAISTFPASSGNASISVSFANPSCSISISGGLFGPYTLTSGQYVLLNFSVTNAATTILPANITGATISPPTTGMTATLVQSPNNIIPPGQTRTIQVNLTQGNPPYNGTLSITLTGSSVGNGCAGSPLSCSATVSNIIIYNSTPGGGGTIHEYCQLVPNPISLATSPVQVNATCWRSTNGMPGVPIQCPTLNWSTTAPNTSISPNITTRSMMPFSSLSRSGNTPGGILRVTNGTISCNATILPYAGGAPPTYFCQLVPNPISLATSPVQVNATCYSNASGTVTQIQCPQMNWATTAPNTSVSPPLSVPSYNPYTSLSRNGNTSGGVIRFSNSNNSIVCTATILPFITGGGSTTDYCTLSPSPISLATTPVRVNATCYRVVGNNPPFQVPCPSLSWSTTAPNTSVSPASTPGGLSPFSNLSRLGNTPGGMLLVTNGTMSCNATIQAYGVGGGSQNLCIILPNPLQLGVDPVAASARCFVITNGVPQWVPCPPLTWVGTNANITITPTTTPPGMEPNVTLNYSGLVPWGMIQAFGGPYACNASVSCGPLNCSLSTSSPYNSVVPPNTLNLTATCANQTSPNAKCSGLNWTHNLVNVSLQYSRTNASVAPANKLYTNSNTPTQVGSVWAVSNDYCSVYYCAIPPSFPYPNITISNQSCSIPCNMTSPMSGQPLSYGFLMTWFGKCYSALTGQQVGCPVAWWRSNAGNFTPNQTASSPGQITSELNVTNITGTYVRINYTDFNGYACSCNASLISALPDYVPLISRVVPPGSLMLGNTVQIYHKTKNQGNADAVNDTTTQIEMPGGSPVYNVLIAPPLDANQFSPESPPFNYTCAYEGVFTYTITADSFHQQDESDETNNQVNGTINCGNVLVCADYI